MKSYQVQFRVSNVSGDWINFGPETYNISEAMDSYDSILKNKYGKDAKIVAIWRETILDNIGLTKTE